MSTSGVGRNVVLGYSVFFDAALTFVYFFFVLSLLGFSSLLLFLLFSFGWSSPFSAAFPLTCFLWQRVGFTVVSHTIIIGCVVLIWAHVFLFFVLRVFLILIVIEPMPLRNVFDIEYVRGSCG